MDLASSSRRRATCLRIETMYMHGSRRGTAILSTFPRFGFRRIKGALQLLMNEARLSHLPFWGPSEGFFFIN